jgi:hypothetical protein
MEEEERVCKRDGLRLVPAKFSRNCENSGMLRMSSPTHASMGVLKAPPPQVVARVLGDLSLEDQQFAAEHALPFCDMLTLLNAPSLNETLDERRLAVLVMQLDLSLREREWRMAEIVLCMLVRTDLVKFYDVACGLGMGYIAQRAAQKHGKRAASTARFGGMLVCKLHNLCAARDLHV